MEMVPWKTAELATLEYIFNKQFADFVGFDSPLWTHLVQFRLPNFQWS